MYYITFSSTNPAHSAEFISPATCIIALLIERSTR